MKILKSIFYLVAAIFCLFVAQAASAADPTISGELTLTPTFENIGVIADYSGDDNNNGSATLEYRVSGGTWKQAPQMWKDTRTTVTSGSRSQANPHVTTYRGSIFWLTSNTTYEVRVTFTDANGVTGTNPVTATVTTRNDNPPSTGNSYYVSTSGSDSNAGTEGAPFKTISKAASVVAAGATVYVKAGIYTENISLSQSGVSTNYITFRNYGADLVTINGGFYGDGTSYVRIHGFTMNRASVIINFTNNAHDNIIEDCKLNVSDGPAPNWNDDSCILLNYGAYNILVQRNIMTVSTAVPYDDNDHADKNGVYWWRSGGGNVFRDNTVSGQPYDGFGGGPENEFGYGGNADFYNNTVIDAHDDGIQPEGDDVNTRIYNNTVSRSFVGIAACPVAIGPVYIFRNVIYDLQNRNEPGDNGAFKLGDATTGRIYIYHNTVYLKAGSNVDGPFATNAGLQNMVLRNNIIRSNWYAIEFGHNNYDIVNHDFDYDLLYSDGADARFIKWGPATYDQSRGAQWVSDTGMETHGLVGVNPDNEFVNTTAGDFNLKSGSQLIDKGVVLIGFNDVNSPWPYTGSAPDLGAIESGPSAPDTTPPLRSNGAPSGSLAYGTTQTTISLTTNENATCKYGTVAGTIYGSLPNTFSSTGGTSHSLVMSGLSNGSSYTYYVRCQDGSANQNTDDFIISFSVSSTPSSDTTPPTLSGGQPSGTLAAGTTQTNIFLTTNENATCKYSTTAGVVYDSMTNVFSTTGATSHSAPVTGLSSGVTYTYYVRCQDTSANKNTSDFTISFSIASSSSCNNCGLGTPTTNPSTVQPNQAFMIYCPANGSHYDCIDAFVDTTQCIWSSWSDAAATFNCPGQTAGTYTAKCQTVTGTGSNCCASSQTASFIIPSAGGDTTPPVRSNGLPSGALSYGTTQTNISLTTNEPATCKYSTVANTAYDSMANTFTTTGSTNHSRQITGLTNGSAYTYYVRCSDVASNKNTDDFTISFSVSASSAVIIDKQIAAGADDAGTDENIWSTTRTFLDAGNAAKDKTGMKFNNIIIPNGASISEAYITVTAAAYNNGSTVTTRIQGEKTSSPAQYSTLTNYIARTLTTDYIDWAMTSWSQGTVYTSPSLVNVVQELVNTYNYSAGAPMAFQFNTQGTPTNSDYRTWSSYNGSVANAPRLHIVYITGGSPSPTPSFTLSGTNMPHLFRGKTNLLQISGSDFNLGTNFTIQFLQNLNVVSSFSAQPASASNLELNLTSAQVNQLPIGFYDLKIIRTTDSISQTYVNQILVTQLGDIWSSNATELTEQKRDGKINIYDVSRMFSKWGSTVSADLTECDISAGPDNISQGKIDLYDANKMMANWLP